MTRNLAIDWLRARPPIASGDDAMNLVADTAPHADQRLEAMGQAVRIKNCFDRLDPDRFLAVKSAYLDGVSYDDLARRFGVPLNTMRTWLRRGLLSLRESMEQ